MSDKYFNGICEHKDILCIEPKCYDGGFFWLAPMDYLGTFVLVLMLTVGTMGGVGGGGTVAFLIKYLLYFPLKEAVALS